MNKKINFFKKIINEKIKHSEHGEIFYSVIPWVIYIPFLQSQSMFPLSLLCYMHFSKKINFLNLKNFWLTIFRKIGIGE